MTRSDEDSRKSLHANGNAVDIHTTTLSADERVILIRAAIESGFGEIYHGTNGGTNGISSEENKKFECFWLADHHDHLHLALENQFQKWETCINPSPVIS